MTLIENEGFSPEFIYERLKKDLSFLSLSSKNEVDFKDFDFKDFKDFDFKDFKDFDFNNKSYPLEIAKSLFQKDGFVVKEHGKDGVLVLAVRLGACVCG